MSTASEVMEQIIKHGQTTADGSTKHVGELAVGDHTCQGDFTVWKLGVLPDGVIPIANPERKLVSGTTKGSLHCVKVEDMARCQFYRLRDPNPLQGPVIDASEAGMTVEHPEHGDQVFPPGLWFVSYQRMHADELRRAED